MKVEKKKYFRFWQISSITLIHSFYFLKKLDKPSNDNIKKREQITNKNHNNLITKDDADKRNIRIKQIE